MAELPGIGVSWPSPSNCAEAIPVVRPSVDRLGERWRPFQGSGFAFPFLSHVDAVAQTLTITPSAVTLPQGGAQRLELRSASGTVVTNADWSVSTHAGHRVAGDVGQRDDRDRDFHAPDSINGRVSKPVTGMDVCY